MTDFTSNLPELSADEPLRYQGSCHCGAVTFEVVVRKREAVVCNCSICRKKGFLHYIVPPEDFTLLQGESSLTDYRFNTKTAQHLFCKHCGIHAFYRPRSHPDHWDINLNCLDAALEPNFLKQFQIQDFDGQAWEDNIHTLRQDDKVANTDSDNASQ